MNSPVGNELVVAQGVASLGRPSGQTELFTTQQIANLASVFSTGSYNFEQYLLATGQTLASDATTQLQNFLLYCQLQAYSLKGTTLDDQVQTNYVTAYIPDLRVNISSPLIVPQRVNLQLDGIIVRVGSAGTVTNFYTGNTLSKALANRIMPTVIIVPGGHCTKANIYCNSNGADNGSGLFFGKNWTMYGATLSASGKNYQVNDVLTFYQPNKAPYIAAQITVNSVNASGGISTYTLSNAGAYALPPVLQQQQWTTVNGFPGAFDIYGNLSGTGGSGTGASFAPEWLSDWGTQGAGGGSTYSGGMSGLITDSIIGTIRISQSSRYVDGTYGATFDAQGFGLNYSIDDISTVSGSQHGIDFFSAADVRANKLNPVDSGTAHYFQNCSSIECPMDVIDTPSGNDSVIYIDNCSFLDLKGEIFKRNMQNVGSNPPATISIGTNSTSGQTCGNVRLKYNINSGGSGGNQSNISSIGCPALFWSYIESAVEADLNITNRQVGYSGQYPVVSSMVKFGTNPGSGLIKGSIDQAFGALYSGTLPSTVAFDVFDAEVSLTTGTVTATIGGTATNGDIITLTFTNAMFAPTYAWPRSVTYTVTAGQTTTQIAAAIVAVINADALFNISGVISSNAANVITIGQMGQDANSTVITASVSGSATETVTFSNSGQVSGSVSGGKLITGGIYQLSAAGVPASGVMGAGWNKAGYGSRYINTANGDVYTNNGTATSPAWTKFGYAALAGTFANRPASPVASQQYFATNLGSAGLTIVYNGSKWMPVGGVGVLAQLYPNSFHTGTTTEFNIAITNIPAGLLSANGALRITSQWSFPNNANNKTTSIRASTTSGDVSTGTLYWQDTQTTKASSKTITQIQNSNSQSAQTGWINNGQYGDSSGSAVASSIATATAPWYLNFNVLNANSADSTGLIQYTVEWLES